MLLKLVQYINGQYVTYLSE